MADRFSPDIFIQSLPEGAAQRNNKLSILQSKMMTAGINVFLDLFENSVIPEKDVDNPLWNPVLSLSKWMNIFKIENAVMNNDYSDPEFLNYLVRFYNRLLVHRPVPISLSALNTLFQTYEDFGMSIRFDDVFTLGYSVLEHEEFLGLPGSSSIITIDSSAKYFNYYPVVVRLLLRVLPINASIRVESPFSLGNNIPPYNMFHIVHDCNAPYQALDTELIYADGDFELHQSPVQPLELNNFLVKKDVIFNLIPFRSQETIPALYLSFFILNISTQVLTVELVLDDEVLQYTLSDLAVDRWTSVLITAPQITCADTIKSLRLYSDINIYDTYNQFYIDHVRLYNGNTQTISSDLYVETELDYKMIQDTPLS